MKKLLSVMLSVVFLFQAAGVVKTVCAESESSVLYTIPNTEFVNGRKHIGVNQGKIKIVFNNTPGDELVQDITFCDSLGKSPEGGVYKSMEDEKTVLLEFGELKEKENYTLSVSDLKTVSYTTVEKELVAEDFEDWPLGNTGPQETGYFSFSENPDLKGYTESETAEFSVCQDASDKYLRILNPVLKKNILIGAQTTNNLVDAKIVSFISFRKTNEENIPSAAEVSGLRGWKLNGRSYVGFGYASFDNFDKNENGFYEIMSVNEKYDSVLTDGAANVKFFCSAYDIIGGTEKTKTLSYSENPADSKVYTSVAVKSYHTKEADLSDYTDITSYRAGFYSVPKILGKPQINGAEVSFYINTDVNKEKFSQISVYIADSGEKAEISDLSCEGRKISFTTGTILSEKDYTIDFGEMQSLDGLFIEPYRCDESFMEGISENRDINIYISPSGNDYNSGNQGLPIRTVKRLSEILYKINDIGFLGNVNVNFAGGTYRFAEPFVIDGINYRLRLNGSSGTVFTTAEAVEEDDKKPAGPNIKNRLSESVKESVVEIDLEKYIPARYREPLRGVMYKGFCLYSADNEERISSYPNDGFIMLDNSNFEKVGESVQSDSSVLKTYSISLPRAEFWSDADVYVEGYFEWMWSYYRINGVESDSLDKNIVLNTKATLKEEDRFKVLNLLEEIDVPGEWCAEGGKIYYYPENDNVPEISRAEIDLFSLADTDNLVINGISFKNIAGEAVKIKECDNLTISGCKFINIGKAALISDSGSEIKNAEIKNNYFENLSYIGIDITGGDRGTLAESGNEISENIFNNIATFARAYSPAIKVNGVGNVVSYNTIRNSPHMCIGFSGSKNKILYNYISEACRETGDCGAIYAGRNFTWVDNEIAYNYIENALITDSDLLSSWRSSFQTGIYMDDRLGGSHIHHNYIKNAVRGIFIGAGSNSNIHDNVTENCSVSGIRIGGAQELSFEDDELTQAAVEYFEEYPVYLTEYPYLLNIIDEETYTTHPHNNNVSDNIYVGEIPSEGTVNGNVNEINSQYENNVVYENISTALADKGINLQGFNYGGAGNEVKLRYPKDGESYISSAEVEFGWELVPGAKEYVLTLKDENGAGLAEITTRNTYCTLTDIDESEHYTWQVKAVMGNDEFILSQEYQFTADMPVNAKRILFKTSQGRNVRSIEDAESFGIDVISCGECKVIVGVYNDGRLKQAAVNDFKESYTLPHMKNNDTMSVFIIDNLHKLSPLSYKLTAGYTGKD